MMLLSYYFARTHRWPVEASFSLRILGRALKEGFWALMIPVIIWGGIFGGIATATEVGGVAALSAILIGVIIYRELTWRDLWKTLVDSSLQTAVIMLIVPIVLPLIKELGIDPIHFGLMVTINLGIGQQTPPVATVLITTCTIANLPMWEVFKTGVYYMLVLVLLTLLVTYVPQTGLWLVNLVYGG